MEAAARTAGHIGDEPGERYMTRHDMLQPHAAGAQSPVTDPRVPMVIIDVKRATASRVPGRQHSAAAQRSGPSILMPASHGCGRAIADTVRNPKSP